MRTFGGEVHAVGTAFESHSGAFCGGSVRPGPVFHSDDMRNDLPTASMVGTTRVGGIDFNSQRMQRVVRGLQALAAWPRGFTASQLASHVVAQKTGEICL